MQQDQKKMEYMFCFLFFDFCLLIDKTSCINVFITFTPQVLRVQPTEVQIYASAFLIRHGYYYCAVKAGESDGRLMRTLVVQMIPQLDIPGELVTVCITVSSSVNVNVRNNDNVNVNVCGRREALPTSATVLLSFFFRSGTCMMHAAVSMSFPCTSAAIFCSGRQTVYCCSNDSDAYCILVQPAHS